MDVTQDASYIHCTMVYYDWPVTCTLTRLLDRLCILCTHDIEQSLIGENPHDSQRLAFSSYCIIGLKSRCYEMQVGGDRDPSCSRAGVQNHVTIPTVVYLLIW